ncbi:plant cysteine oxidase 2-like isoform X2 [Magnolia sinica]|uniref:plant cysteine oxidase 2-like isoform X2 n=1 Tax=Magnolia sinica TaxID=86752 RepID=UPI0026591730|nr:plant cysteine oxidase 2-like isoform X2 [Magnolia sinica]
MRIETGLINRKGQQFCELPASATVAAAEKSRAKKNRRRQRKPMQAAVVQKLFNACKEVFSGSEAVPSPSDVERVRSVLDTMTPADVGLNRDIPLFRKIGTEGAPPITYLHLYECSKFSIGIFCLPPSGVIPLHNHPGMTVFSKLLFGSMHIKSYDWADIPRTANEIVNPSHWVRLAKVKVDDVFTAPCNTSILYPAAGGNMHRFTAMTSCAVLDVLGPPYADSEGRHCTYYRDFPYARFSGDMDLELGSEEGGVYAWLEETEKPSDFFVVGDKYRGPKIVEN